MNIFTNNSSLIKFHAIQYYLIILLILTLPYRIAPAFSILLSSLIFFITFFSKNINLKELLSEKSILFLFIYIVFIYISPAWSPAQDIFGGEFKVTIYGYMNYLFLIPALYFSNFSKKELTMFFTFIIISPTIYIVVYYTNFLHLTNISYLDSQSLGKHMYVHLFANLFILLGSILIYIKFTKNMILKNYLKATLLFCIFSLMGISLFLEKEVTSRLISLVWLIAIIFVTFSQIPSKLRLIIAVGIVLLSITYITNSNRFQKGFSEVKDVYVNNKFEGSWGHRLKLAEYGINMWLENPIIGRGIVDPVDKMRELKKINPDDFKDPTIHFHNQLILILVQVGLLGFTLFLSFFYYFYTLKIKDTEINLFKRITLLAYFLVMFGEHYLHMIYTSTFFALLIGLFFAYKNQEKLNV